MSALSFSRFFSSIPTSRVLQGRSLTATYLVCIASLPADTRASTRKIPHPEQQAGTHMVHPCALRITLKFI